MSPPENASEEVARLLLEIEAVTLSPRQPYTWASGVRSPIYCDCRRIASFPDARKFIEDAWAQLLRAEWPSVQAVVGVATGGVPHAALVAERLGLPMAYVRSETKGHGLGKRVEGFLPKQVRVVVVEDLVSTGSSLLEAVKALKTEDIQVVGATAVFSYGLDIAREAFAREGVPLRTLTGLSEVKRAAAASGRLSAEELTLVDEGIARVAQQLAARR